VNTAINSSFPYNAGDFLTGKGNVSFSRRTQFHVVCAFVIHSVSWLDSQLEWKEILLLMLFAGSKGKQYYLNEYTHGSNSKA
jgi:hypothetical protein